MNDLISIIIPIYNGELYLEGLLSSIEKQTYKNFEVIMINDGSTDNSGNICMYFMKKDNRFNYYEKQNSGVSNSRNYGIGKANGKYICFLDADDSVSENYLYDFIKLLNKYKKSLICCDFIKYSTILKRVELSNNVHIYEGDSKYDVLFEKYGGYLWNKVFEKEILINNNICFNTDISMCEDLLFVYQYIYYIDKVITIENKNYNYRVISNSASKNKKNLKWFTIFNTFDELLANTFDKSNFFINKLMYYYNYYLLEAKYRLKYIDKGEKYVIKKDIEYRIKNKPKYDNFDIKQKIKLIVFKYFNNIAFYIKKRKELKV